MRDEERIPTAVNGWLWTVGWYWQVFALYVPAIGVALGALSMLGVGPPSLMVGAIVLFFGGPVIAAVGVGYVRLNYDEVVNVGVVTVGERAMKAAGVHELENAESFPLRSDVGGPVLLPPVRIDITTLTVGDVMANVHHEQTVDLRRRVVTVGSGASELYYDRIAGVDYRDGRLWIDVAEGGERGYPCDEEPVEALRALRDRLRAYKRGQQGAGNVT